MSFLSLIFVLLLEQLRPVPVQQWVIRPVRAWADFLESQLNAGEYRNGIIGWLAGALFPAVIVGVAGVLLGQYSALWAIVFNVLILFLTLGFRQFSHSFTQIREALSDGDLPRARELLKEWRGGDTHLLSSTEVASIAIETGLLASHRHVFAVLVAFVVFPGASGPVLYRLSHLLSERWSELEHRSRSAVGNSTPFADFSNQLFEVLDWLPARMTAFAFAVVGDFEDALHCWRHQASEWREASQAVIMTAGAGALGIRLGVARLPDEVSRTDYGVGDVPVPESMDSAVGLLWRALLFWLLLLLALTVASWF